MASSNTPEKTAKNSASERFVSLTDKDVERFVEAEANKNTQRKLHSDIVSMKSFLPNENKTRQLQDIPPPELDAYLISFLLSVRKKSDDEYEPTTLRGIIASVERYLKNLRYICATASLVQRSTVELFERYLFKQISQFRDETVDQFVCRLRQQAANCDFAEFGDDHVRINR